MKQKKKKKKSKQAKQQNHAMQTQEVVDEYPAVETKANSQGTCYSSPLKSIQ